MKSDENVDILSRLDNRKMLIVALDRWIRESLVHYFRSIGCDTASSDNGRDAQKALSRAPFDAVIADHTLSDMSGIDFLKSIHGSHPGIIKLYITSDNREEAPPSTGSMRIHIIEKPFTVDAIYDAFVAFFGAEDNLAPEG